MPKYLIALMSCMLLVPCTSKAAAASAESDPIVKLLTFDISLPAQWANFVGVIQASSPLFVIEKGDGPALTAQHNGKTPLEFAREIHRRLNDITDYLKTIQTDKHRRNEPLGDADQKSLYRFIRNGDLASIKRLFEVENKNSPIAYYFIKDAQTHLDYSKKLLDYYENLARTEAPATPAPVAALTPAEIARIAREEAETEEEVRKARQRAKEAREAREGAVTHAITSGNVAELKQALTVLGEHGHRVSDAMVQQAKAQRDEALKPLERFTTIIGLLQP